MGISIEKYQKTIDIYKNWFKENYENGTIKQDLIMPYRRSFWKNPIKSLDEGRGTRFFEMINRHFAEFNQTAANVYTQSSR